jgi:hypothetical protein
MKQFSNKEFKELENQWYSKLAETGFEDIEDTKDKYRKLKRWHGADFKRIRPTRLKNQQKFYEMAWTLLHTKTFKDKNYKKIWHLFCEGFPIRKIAAHMGIPKSTVHWIIGKISKDIKWK